MAVTRPTSISKEDTLSSSEYRSQRETQLFDLRQSLLEGSIKYEKDLYKSLYDAREKQVQDIYNYQIELATKEEKQQIEIATKVEKKKLELEKKYGKERDKTQEKRYKNELKAYEKFIKAQQEIQEREAQKEVAKQMMAQRKEASETFFAKGKTMQERFGALSDLKKSQGGGAVVDALVAGIADLAKKLDGTVEEIVKYQSKWDTRLWGSGVKYENSAFGQRGILGNITGIVGVSPIVQQKQVLNKVDDLVSKGIAYNVEQRAFLGTISEKIATTFDSANGTLLKLIRVQQSDTTAARLGLEANLNAYLNGMYKNTEYLSDMFDTVSENIYEATSQYTYETGGGVDFEYQVQKWLGSLYSVGMSQGAISSISTALGQLGSGNINALMGNTAMQNLLAMSASKAGLSYSEMLTDGLNASELNDLMGSMVSYLARIAGSDNNVVKSQYANIFGMSMSDLKAISNLSSSLVDIHDSTLDYSSALDSLYETANSIYSRMSVGEIMSNAWANVQYSMASGIASNPALYALWKASNLLDDVAGGIALPDIKVMGSGVNLQTSVADLMRVGALSGGILSSIGSMIAAGGGGGFDASGMIKSIMNIGTTSVVRGSGLGSVASGETVSKSNYVGNTSGSDVYDSSMAGVSDQKNELMVEATENDNKQQEQMDKIEDSVIKMYELFDSCMVNGALRVSFQDSTYTPGPNPSGM